MADYPYKLPYFELSIPFPPSDLALAVLAVLVFLPATVLVHNFLSALLFRKKKKSN